MTCPQCGRGTASASGRCAACGALLQSGAGDATVFPSPAAPLRDQAEPPAADAGATARLGVKEQDIVVASVYTTQSITSVMERIRDQIKAEAPAPASFALGPAGQRAVFDAAAVSRIAWRQRPE